MGRRGFAVSRLLSDCNSAKAVLMASSCAPVNSLMSFWSARISSISSRMAFNPCSNWATFPDKVIVVSDLRMAINALVTLMLISMATSLRKTLESISAPCSVKARGSAVLGRLDLDVITNCDEISAHSSAVN